MFLARQFILAIPRELIEAARIDGAGHLRIFTRIVLPLCRPLLAVLFFMSFLQTWNDFAWPLIALKDNQLFTLPIGLLYLQGQFGSDYGGTMAFALRHRRSDGGAVPRVPALLRAGTGAHRDPLTSVRSPAAPDARTVAPEAPTRVPSIEGRPVEVHEILARFARLAAPPGTVGPPGPDCLALACIQIAGADGGALTVEYTGVERMTVFASDAVARRIEDLHEVLGEGPGWEAHGGTEPVVGLLRDASRWPGLADAAEDLGDLAVTAMPVHAGGDVVAVLMLYRREGSRPGGDPEDLMLVTVLAGLVGAVFAATPSEDWDTRLPWAQRDVIHQATGMLVVQLRLPVDDAAAVLRSYAFSHDIDLHDAAVRVLEHRADLRLPGSGPE